MCLAGRAVVHTYVGDFMGLCDEWRLLRESLQADGICPRGEPREHYETSPEEVNDPAEHVTSRVATRAEGGVRWTTRSDWSPRERTR